MKSQTGIAVFALALGLAIAAGGAIGQSGPSGNPIGPATCTAQPSSGQKGTMSPADKCKLDAIPSGFTGKLSQVYNAGSSAADQTATLTNAKGGAVRLTCDTTGSNFTDNYELYSRCDKNSGQLISQRNDSSGTSAYAGFSTLAHGGKSGSLTTTGDNNTNATCGAGKTCVNGNADIGIWPNNTGGCTFLYSGLSGSVASSTLGWFCPNDISLAQDTTVTGLLNANGSAGLSIANAGATERIYLGAGNSAAVSDANTGTIRYNSGTQTFQASVNGGAYADLGSGSATSWRAKMIARAAVALGTTELTVDPLGRMLEGWTLGAAAGTNGVTTDSNTGIYRMLQAAGQSVEIYRANKIAALNGNTSSTWYIAARMEFNTPGATATSFISFRDGVAGDLVGFGRYIVDSATKFVIIRTGGGADGVSAINLIDNAYFDLEGWQDATNLNLRIDNGTTFTLSNTGTSASTCQPYIFNTDNGLRIQDVVVITRTR